METDTTTTRPRLVNCMVGRIRTESRGYDVAPYWVDCGNGGAWGVPFDAFAYAGLLAARTHCDMAVHIVDVNSGEEWFTTVPARYGIEHYNGESAAWAIRDTVGGHYLGPFHHIEAEQHAASLNLMAIAGS